MILPCPLPQPSPDPPLSVTEGEVMLLLRGQNLRKAAGPDSVSPAVLKQCTYQLAPVFTDIFNTSLELYHVPACFKAAAIIPVPKKTMAMVLEHLVLVHLKGITGAGPTAVCFQGQHVH